MQFHGLKDIYALWKFYSQNNLNTIASFTNLSKMVDLYTNIGFLETDRGVNMWDGLSLCSIRPTQFVPGKLETQKQLGVILNMHIE